jgi:PAS domain S-box-containing protein
MGGITLGRECCVSNQPADDEQSPLGSAALHALIEQAPDAIFVADPDGRYRYVNEAGCRMLGYTRAELVGMTILETIAPAHAERLARSRTAMLEGPTRTAEWLLRRKDGSFLPVEVNAKILPDDQWQGFVRDISERTAHETERLALFEAIAGERRRLQTLLDTLPLGLVFFDAGGKVSANRRAEEIVGTALGPEGGSAQYADRIFYPDGTRVPSAALMGPRVHRGETIIGEEYVVRRPDGSELPVLGSAAPIRDREGRVVGGVGVFQDISERMRLEQSVRDNERLLKAVFDIIPVGIRIADRSQRIVSQNPAAERIWDGARSLEGARFGEYQGWWADTGEPVAAQEWPLARAIAQGDTCPGKLIRIRCHDGSFKTIIDAAAPLRDENGNLTGAVAVNEDITALDEAQERLRASEELFRTVFDLLPVGLWIADRDGRVTRGNPAGHRIWQGAGEMGPEHYGRQQGWSIQTGKPIASEEWGIPRAIRGGEATPRDLIRIQCFDGSFKTLINWAAPIRSHTGEITGAVAVNEDITALHHTQEQLRIAVRDREDILAMVTHDLRSPLSAIMTLATTIGLKSHKLAGGEPVNAMAENVIEIARQMFGLVNDLLAVALVHSDHSVLKTTPTRSAALLEKAARVSRPLFAREGIRFEVQAVGELPVIHVDTDRVLRVFGNLLDNALKFTQATGEVLLRAEAQSAGVRYCVANSGPPLSQAELDSMFQPFWQAGRGDLRGAGLGLSICRTIIEAHGGTIWAEPAAGKRVRICFLLPSANPLTFAPAPG